MVKEKVNKVSQIIGVVSLIFFAWLMTLYFGTFIRGDVPEGNPLVYVLLIFAFGYTSYKTLLKKQNLTKSEFIVLGILTIFILFIIHLAFF